MINYIVGGRGSGKTLRLIQLSSRTGYPILVKDQQRKNWVVALANKLEYKIPDPITLMEWHIIQMILSKDSKLYIDDIEDVIQEIFQYRVDAATLIQPTNIENLDDKV